MKCRRSTSSPRSRATRADKLPSVNRACPCTSRRALERPATARYQCSPSRALGMKCRGNYHGCAVARQSHKTSETTTRGRAVDVSDTGAVEIALRRLRSEQYLRAAERRARGAHRADPDGGARRLRVRRRRRRRRRRPRHRRAFAVQGSAALRRRAAVAGAEPSRAGRRARGRRLVVRRRLVVLGGRSLGEPRTAAAE